MLAKNQRSACSLEEQLLLDCSRTSLSPEVVERVRRTAQGEVKWDYVLKKAAWHSVLPLLCYHLVRLKPGGIPARVHDVMQARLKTHSTRNLALATELMKILRLLEANGISALPFKGPILALSGYGNLALREFCDLDVLVRESDFAIAKELFLAQGFQPWTDLTPREEVLHFQSNHAYTLVRSSDGLHLDLHWRIAQEHYSFGLDVESLWGRARRLTLCGHNVLQMSPEDLLTVLCIHGSKHYWERLGWVCDIAEVVRANSDLNWEQILATSAAINSSGALLLGLDLAAALLNAQLPAPVLSAIDADRRIRRVSRLIQRRLFARTRKIGPLETAAIFFMTRERLRDRLPHLTYSLNRVVTPNQNDTSMFDLPSCLYFLYYPLRAMRLTRAALERMFSRTH